MTLIIAILMTLGIISSPEQATEQVIQDNTAKVTEVIGEDFEAF